MAFAHCPNCRKAFRYQVEAKTGPVWLREFARAVGKGDPAVVLCAKCWFVPEIGDEVEVTQLSEDATEFTIGSIGRVLEIRNEESAYPIFLVEGLPATDAAPSIAQFRRWEIRACNALIAGTLRFNLNADCDSSQT